MWRSIVLGKLIISIVASIIVGIACWRASQGAERTVAESGQWLLLSLFFFGLAICFCVTLFLLFYKKKRSVP